jgi:hypothetical protein
LTDEVAPANVFRLVVAFGAVFALAALGTGAFLALRSPRRPPKLDVRVTERASEGVDAVSYTDLSPQRRREFERAVDGELPAVPETRDAWAETPVVLCGDEAYTARVMFR